ncbi:HAMP domain-containing protein, partial [Arhodomonas sp. AD133]|uniref:HAMP domain-containing protein n=1 Tax=Arhodomonas sp. AD133 TaxID=3415009 RepID=UPI003EC13D79
MTLNRKIQWLGAALMGAALLAIFLIMQFLARPELYKDELKEAQQTVNGTGDQLRITLQAAESQTQAIAQAAENLPLERETFIRQIEPLVNDYGNAVVAGGGVWPEPNALMDGQERASLFWARGENGRLSLLDDYNDPASDGYHGAGWYQVGRTLSRGECGWSESYEDPVSGTPMVTCTVAIERAGSFWGVATIDLMLSGLEGMLAERNADTGGYTLVVDQTGRILSFPGIREESLAMMTLGDAVSDYPELAPLKAALEQDGTVELPEGVLPDEESVLIQTTLPDQQWTVAMVLPRSTAMASVNSVTRDLYLFLTPVLLAFVIVAVVAARRVIHPLRRLADTLANLGSDGGDLRTRLDEDRADELGDLARGFNAFAAELQTIVQRV